MYTRSDLLKLGEEDIYLILYLRKVKGCSDEELTERFQISIDSLMDLLDGQARKACYEKFSQIEKYLVEAY